MPALSPLSQPAQGKLLIFSAPSGSGKSTIVGHLMQVLPSLAFSVSAATRAPRGNERDGVDYHFLSVEAFRQHIAQDDFVEWEEVYANQYYGTLKSELERIWGQGKTAVFDVDVKGGLRLKQLFGDRALAVFIQAPSIEVLRERLTARGTDSPESIAKRLDKAARELEFREQFDVCVVNDRLDQALTRAEEVVRNFLNLTA